MKELRNEIQKIKKRNVKVEADKAWETSTIRKLIILILTYFTIVIFFITTQLPKPFINAIVPSLAFLLSNLSLPFFKKFYLKYFYKQ